MTPTFRRTGSITANPNPVVVPRGATVGETTLQWTSDAKTVVVCVGSPGGQVFAATPGGNHSAKTGKWVVDNLTFYLQDVSEKQRLTSAHTLATVTVHLKPQ